MGFLVIEGIDGAGKSTVAEVLVRHLEQQGEQVLSLREPGSTALGERVRSILLDPAVGSMEPWAEAHLFCACRSQMVARQIRPALESGGWVILDRYFYSSLCYQGFAMGLDVDQLRQQNLLAVGDLQPAKVLLLDLPVELANARLGGTHDRMEGRGLEFLESARQGFLRLARADPQRWHVLDASSRPAELGRAALAACGLRSDRP